MRATPLRRSGHFGHPQVRHHQLEHGDLEDVQSGVAGGLLPHLGTLAGTFERGASRQEVDMTAMLASRLTNKLAPQNPST